MPPNWQNRTLFHGDNLDFMRAMNSESVDLIATDPPFNKGRDFHATPDSLSEGAAFQDRWSWSEDVHESWTDQISDDWPNVWEVINSSRKSYGDDMGAYLCFMGVRLIAMRRLLKPTGSLYLHCDPTASHYLKMLLDAIYGKKNFRNEVVWCYKSGGAGQQNFSKKHDIIFRYTKTGNFVFNRLREKSYNRNLKPYKFRGVEEFEDEIGWYTLVGMKDYWFIDMVGRTSPERYGYPTQKPLALYERIIKASSNEGDIVLDPFAGCATTPVAAERLGRQWVGIDIWEKAQEAVIHRLENEGLKAPKGTRRTKKTVEKYDLFAKDFEFTSQLPERTDDEEVDVAYMPTLRRALQSRWQRLSNAQIREELEIAQEKDGWIICAGCGRKLEPAFMELDHITPRSSNGPNDISNRILLCSPCNRTKSNVLTLDGLRQKNKKSGWLLDEQEAKAAQSRAYNKYVEVSLRS